MKRQMVTKEAKFTKQYKYALFTVMLITIPIGVALDLFSIIGELADKLGYKFITFNQRFAWLLCYWYGVDGFFYKDIPEEDEE